MVACTKDMFDTAMGDTEPDSYSRPVAGKSTEAHQSTGVWTSMLLWTTVPTQDYSKRLVCGNGNT